MPDPLTGGCYSRREKTPEMMVLKVGTLDDSGGMKLVMNIWTNSSRPWMHRDPATESHPQNRPVKSKRLFGIDASGAWTSISIGTTISSKPASRAALRKPITRNSGADHSRSAQSRCQRGPRPDRVDPR